MELEQAKQQFIQTWGNFGTQWGINKSMAQVHALLLVSERPLSTEEVMEQLSISRGNANMNMRDLINWNLVYWLLFIIKTLAFLVLKLQITCIQSLQVDRLLLMRDHVHVFHLTELRADDHLHQKVVILVGDLEEVFQGVGHAEGTLLAEHLHHVRLMRSVDSRKISLMRNFLLIKK